MKKNTINKIRKWLKGKGYRITFAGTEWHTYLSGSYKGETYIVHYYRTSTGYYIKYKPYGKAEYYLCEKIGDISGLKIAFTQSDFIREIEPFF